VSRARNPWIGVGLGAWCLGLEASTVIGLRLLKITAGGAAGQAEAQRMVREKLDAGLALRAMALTGGLGSTPQEAAAKTVAHLRRKVRANRLRLSKG
jgi:hypothetical protein